MARRARQAPGGFVYHILNRGRGAVAAIRKSCRLRSVPTSLGHTHTMRWHAHYHTSGTGHLYQGRFKAFPVQTDEHFYTVCRYVERNPLRAGLVRQVADWRWSTLWRRQHGDEQPRAFLSVWPLPLPADWASHVQQAQSDGELAALRRAL